MLDALFQETIRRRLAVSLHERPDKTTTLEALISKAVLEGRLEVSNPGAIFWASSS